MFPLGIVSTISPHTAGTNIFASANTERFYLGANGVYGLVKEFTMNSSGNVRIALDLAVSNADYADADIRINDVSVAVFTTVFPEKYPNYRTFSYDSNVLLLNDTIKIYIRSRQQGVFASASLKNARIEISQAISLYTAPTVNLD